MKKLLLYIFCSLLLMSNVWAQKENKTIKESPKLKVVKTKNTNAHKITKESVVALQVKQYLDTLLVTDNGMKLVEQKNLGDEFLNMQEGDNLFIDIPVSVLGKDTNEYKKFITKIEIIKVFPNLEAVDIIVDKSNTIKMANEEDTKIQQFLKERDLEATKLPNGTYLEKIEDGAGNVVGNKPVQITVKYRGILMDNGVVFHQNMKNGQSALTYNTDKYEFLPVCEEILKTMKKGEHIRLYIPSYLAFGKRSIPNILPPYSNLIYELILEDIQPISNKVNNKINK